MAKCAICGKGKTIGHRISINRSQVSKRAKRDVKPNLVNVKIMDQGGNKKTITICTKCKKNI